MFGKEANGAKSGVVAENVKSSAIVKYSSIKSPSPFLELSNNTDLNEPPLNWLKGSNKWKGRMGHWLDPKINASCFSSIHMAYLFPDYLSKVDVISDAENIKKLLKIPFSNSHISMMVHRIGETLLLDEFDIQSHLLRTTRKEWDWLKKFFFEKVVEDIKESETTYSHKKTRGFLQNKHMFSKFLYHSLAEEHGVDKNFCTENLSNKESVQNNPSFLPQGTPPPKTNFIGKEDDGHEFLRNVLWTFEDIRMLIGSDMPIFGGGIHPAVSLRLHDMQKPINVLTGLDYWLDNLMSNVPEVLMCYHLNGFVQKYELIKTEDLPHLSKSKFSPNLIKDVAQNILSFLKSKATKSGHTYWLFKGNKDDFVKLYDLTALCAGEMDDDRDKNAFSFPVSMLLYRLAKNMKESSEGLKKTHTVLSLLQNCLCILEKSKHPQIATSTHYLLSDIYVPSSLSIEDIDAISPFIADEDLDLEFEDEEDEPKYSSVEVKALSIPRRETYDDNCSNKQVCPGSTWIDRCKIALEHVLLGLDCLKISSNLATNKTSDSKSEFNFPIPGKAIPLNYSPIKNSHLTTDFNLKQTDVSSPPKNTQKTWRINCETLLYKKSIQIYTLLSELYFKNGSYSDMANAHKYIKLGILAFEKLKCLEQGDTWANHYMARLMQIAGDVFFFSVKDNCEAKESGFILDDKEEKLLDYLDSNTTKYDWCWNFPDGLETALILSERCYKEGLEFISDTKSIPYQELHKRCGNIQNETGVFYMNQAVKNFNLENKFEEANELLNKSFSHLNKGMKIFEKIEDTPNICLVRFNTGRALKVKADSLASQEIWAHSNLDKKFYKKAIECYQITLDTLKEKNLFPAMWDSLSWDISSIYYLLACQIQDCPPLHNSSYEEVEKECFEYFSKALKYCDIATSEDKLPIYQYRVGNIYYKLGSLYQFSYRNSFIDQRRTKQLKQLSELYYSKSLALFEKLENFSEYLKTSMELATLWKYQFDQQTSFNSRKKSLKSILSTLISAFDKFATVPSPSEFEIKERDTLFQLFQEQMKDFVPKMTKLFSTSAKNKEVHLKWLEIEEKLAHEYKQSINYNKTICKGILKLLET